MRGLRNILNIIVLLASISCLNTVRDKETRQMANLLKETRKSIDFTKVQYYLNKERVKKLEELMVNQKGFELDYGNELLRAGETKKSIQILNKVLEEEMVKSPKSSLVYSLKKVLAIAYMRLGEQENCIANHNHSSCLIPIRGDGFHRLENGSRNSIKLYTELLEINPSDYDARWLLNLAYMTLGEYPQMVPERWKISPNTFRSDTITPIFSDVAELAGVNTFGISGGTCIDDFNNDGFLDIITSSSGYDDPLAFYYSNGDGTFTNKMKDLGLEGITGGLNLIHADYNNDGFLDILVLRGGWMDINGMIPNSLLRNNGGVSFTDVTIASGLLSFKPTQVASWNDFNLDGWIDLLVLNEETKMSKSNSELYVNNQDGTFKNIAGSVGLNKYSGIFKGVAVGDINNDGWPDIYLSILNGNNTLLVHNGNSNLDSLKFLDISETSGTAEPFRSFPSWIWDFNNDGLEDIFVSGYGGKQKSPATNLVAYALGEPVVGEPRIYLNNGDLTFTNVAPDLGLNEPVYTMGSNFGDVDNDGFLDMYLGTGDPDLNSLVPNKLYRNSAGKYFQDITTCANVGNVQKGHGVGFGDLDNDGDEDFYCVLGGAFQGDAYYSSLYRNDWGSQNNWVILKLEGESSNRSAIGARVKVVVEKDNKEISIYRTVSTGGSFGASSIQQEIGIGGANYIKMIEISWPNIDRSKSIFYNVPIKKLIIIKENEKQYIVKDLKSLLLGADITNCVTLPSQ